MGLLHGRTRWGSELVHDTPHVHGVESGAALMDGLSLAHLVVEGERF